MTVLEKAPVESDLTSPRPPLLHAYCARCLRTLDEVPTMCGVKKRESSTFEEEVEGERCVVCLEAQWESCRECGG